MARDWLAGDDVWDYKERFTGVDHAQLRRATSEGQTAPVEAVQRCVSGAVLRRTHSGTRALDARAGRCNTFVRHFARAHTRGAGVRAEATFRHVRMQSISRVSPKPLAHTGWRVPRMRPLPWTRRT